MREFYVKTSQRSWVKDAAALGTLALVLLILFFPVLFQGRTMLPTDMFDTMTLPYSHHYGPPQAYNHNLTDALMQSYPWKAFAQQALRNGELAYWNPLILGGYPQYAASRQAFDIFNLLLIPFDLPLAFNLIIILELFVAGIGMYVLLKAHGISRSVATMFASAWMFNGMFLTHLLNLWVTATFCWVPFALAYLCRYHLSQKRSDLLIAAVFAALAFLGSTLQSAVYVVLILAVVSFFYARASLDVSGSLRRWMLSTSAVIGIALLLSAIMWLPSIELFIEVLTHGKLYSPSHEFEYTIGRRLLSFALLLGFYLPESLGIVRSLGVTSIAGVHPLDFSGYLGFTEMLIATWALFTWRSSKPALHGYTLLLLLGIALPIFTPLFSWLYHRFFIVATVGGCVIAAERFDQLARGRIDWESFRKWHRTAIIFLSLTFVFLLSLNLYLGLNAHAHQALADKLYQTTIGRPFSQGNEIWERSRIDATFHQYSLLSPTMYVPLIVITLSLVLLAQFKYRKLSPQQITFGLFALALCHVFFWWRAWLPMLDTQQFPLYPSNPAITFLQEHAKDARIYVDRRNVPNEQYIFLDNEAAMYGLAEIQGYESQVNRSFYPTLRTKVNPEHPHPALLGALAIKYLVTGSATLETPHLHKVFSGDLNIYENDLFEQRAQLIYNVGIVPTDSSAVDSLLADSTSSTKIYFTNTSGIQPCSAALPTQQVDLLTKTGNSVSIVASPTADAYLVLSDCFYPGWKCTVDGKPVIILEANYAMRAVFLHAGRHSVRFIFEPASYRIGKYISLVALTALLGCFFLPRMKLRKFE